jgi:hypothetical protein
MCEVGEQGVDGSAAAAQLQEADRMHIDNDGDEYKE